jgi:D-alanyl-D-alanine endopeptidase (penicillin-binding protein 7)
MNRKANALGMTQTRFADGTGLNSHNVASPKDLVALWLKPLAPTRLISRFSTTGGHAVAIKDSIQQFNNTNMP